VVKSISSEAIEVTPCRITTDPFPKLILSLVPDYKVHYLQTLAMGIAIHVYGQNHLHIANPFHWSISKTFLEKICFALLHRHAGPMIRPGTFLRISWRILQGSGFNVHINKLTHWHLIGYQWLLIQGKLQPPSKIYQGWLSTWLSVIEQFFVLKNKNCFKKIDTVMVLRFAG